MDERHLDELAKKLGAARVSPRRRAGRVEVNGGITGRDPADDGVLDAEKAIEVFRKSIDQHRKVTLGA